MAYALSGRSTGCAGAERVVAGAAERGVSGWAAGTERGVGVEGAEGVEGVEGVEGAGGEAGEEDGKYAPSESGCG